MTFTLARVTGHNLDLTDSINEYLEKRLAKLDRYTDDNDESTSADVDLVKEVADQHAGNIYTAKITMHVAGNYFHAEGDGEDIYAAIDDMQTDIIREVKKHNNKRQSMIRRGARAVKNMLRRRRM